MAFFDDVANDYDSFFDNPIGRAILCFESRAILKMLNPLCGLSALDAACGTGIFTSMLALSGMIVTGVDESGQMIDKAKHKQTLNNATLLRANIESLPFTDGSFDRVLCTFMLEFSENPCKVVSELVRVLKPGGVLVLATLNADGPWARARIEDGIYSNAKFRSKKELLDLVPLKGCAETCVHFPPNTKKLYTFYEFFGNLFSSSNGAAVVARFVK